MIRVKRGNIAQKRHKKLLKLSKGFFAAHSKLFRIANAKILKAFCYSYIGRKQKKRTFRKLWITRINAVTKQNKTKYSTLISNLKKKNLKLNRKSLSYLMFIDSKFLSLILLSN